jgi:hypothetical protein
MVSIQDALGRHQDSVQAIRLLRSVRDGAAADRAYVDPAAFDRLIEVQRALGVAAVADYDRLREPISPGTG